MLIIPAIDIIDGKCVRLRKGDYTQTIFYDLSPTDQAKKFEQMGYKYLHLVDLDGAKNGKPQNLKVLENICLNTNLIVDFGGGIRVCEDVSQIINLGASQVNLGTILLSKPELGSELMGKFGSERLIAAIDCEKLKVKTHGWTENSNQDIFSTIEAIKNLGFLNFTVTDISKDGMMLGPAFELYQNILKQFPDIRLRASGGVSSEYDIEILKILNLESVIVGKMLYEMKTEVIRTKSE
ncbi:MAG: 1-(5-phosphoribosyl)-5-[(5-phosphoribosylamino)methylideneamino]imidazole-4-carboxamide isomerase [Bacteroidales bacterium]|nr:MAG: 1-(5-phosphoribosyl)-5-[(5-phosphoribosylamino)methylideneamino]imidazole-4-carboxamide isomerase [Bacteroidales bacterium]